MTNYTKARLEETARTVEKIDFDMTDDKGRKLGTLLITVTEDVIADENSNWLISEEWVGKTCFGYYLHATRDGASFGALNRTNWFANEAIRDSAAGQSVETSRKRYAKKFG